MFASLTAPTRHLASPPPSHHSHHHTTPRLPQYSYWETWATLALETPSCVLWESGNCTFNATGTYDSGADDDDDGDDGGLGMLAIVGISLGAVAFVCIAAGSILWATGALGGKPRETSVSHVRQILRFHHHTVE